MKNVNGRTKTIVLTTAFSMLAVCIPFHAIYAAPGGETEPTFPSPPRLTGVTIVPLDQQPVPDVLKNMARRQTAQMKSRGYVDVTEDEVSYLDKLKADVDKRLKPMTEVAPTLKVDPANLGSSPLRLAVLLGAVAEGAYTEEGWTGLTRLFVVPTFGLVGLEESDYVAGRGGVAFTKEAINQEVNGFPAVLVVQQSRSNKGLTELSWATDRKDYTLSTNRALKDQKSVDEFLALARSIF